MIASAAQYASAPTGPSRTPPRLIDAPAITLPADAEPIPAGSGVDLTLTIAADGTVTDAQIATPLRDDVDALVLPLVTGMIIDKCVPRTDYHLLYVCIGAIAGMTITRQVGMPCRSRRK